MIFVLKIEYEGDMKNYFKMCGFNGIFAPASTVQRFGLVIRIYWLWPFRWESLGTVKAQTLEKYPIYFSIFLYKSQYFTLLLCLRIWLHPVLFPAVATNADENGNANSESNENHSKNNDYKYPIIVPLWEIVYKY